MLLNLFYNSTSFYNIFLLQSAVLKTAFFAQVFCTSLNGNTYE